MSLHLCLSLDMVFDVVPISIVMPSVLCSLFVVRGHKSSVSQLLHIMNDSLAPLPLFSTDHFSFFFFFSIIKKWKMDFKMIVREFDLVFQFLLFYKSMLISSSVRWSHHNIYWCIWIGRKVRGGSTQSVAIFVTRRIEFGWHYFVLIAPVNDQWSNSIHSSIWKEYVMFVHYRAVFVRAHHRYSVAS